jgi:hypothetical protein
VAVGAAALGAVLLAAGAAVAWSTVAVAAPVARAPAVAPAAFPDGPPARVTGGFGEDTCAACHFTMDDAPPAGRLEVTGFPGGHQAGTDYDLVVLLEDPAMAVAGFQLTTRFDDGSQAGSLSVPEAGRGRVSVVTDRQVAFAQHGVDGTELAEPGAARWVVRWTAPAEPGTVFIHAAALAGDGDRSQEGDRTYALEKSSEAMECGRR